MKALLPKRFYSKISNLSGKKRVYIIPTSIGLYFSFISFILFLIAISYGHNLAFFATFLFFSFVSLSAVITNESINSLSLEISDSILRSNNGRASPYKVTVENRSGRSQFDIAIEINGKQLGVLDEIKPSQTKDFVLDLGLLDLERGYYKIERVALATRFPFGLFYAWKWKAVNLKLFVRPTPKFGHIPVLFKPSLDEGDGMTSFKQGNDDYFETRSHRKGESLMRLDRRQSLRLDQPQVRIFNSLASSIKILDLRAGITEDTLSFAVDCLEKHDPNHPIGVFFPNQTTASLGIGQQHQLELLDNISSYNKKLLVLS